MRVCSGLAAASLFAAATALISNGTTETVTITRTSWSTLLSCPSPTTVTVCNSQCPTLSGDVNSANIVYQTISSRQAGQVVTIGGTATTLAEPTVLTVEETISNLVLVPDAATESDLTAAATFTNIVYPSSVTGVSGQVVTCQTGATTLTRDGDVLTDCPCTVQSTVLELTATGSGPIPTAIVSTSNYIVKIIYVYVIETFIEQIPTTITKTATSVLTTTSGEIATTTSSALPTMVSVESVTFLLEYDSTYDGVADTGLRKRQAVSSPSIPTALNSCLARCAEQTDCQAASFVGSTCVPLRQFDAQSRRVSPGDIFAIVIYRPSAPAGSSSSTNVVSSSGSATLTDRGSSSTPRTSSSLLDSLTFSSSRFLTSLRSSSSAGTDSTTSGLTSSSSSQISSSSARYPMSNSSTSSTYLSSRSSSSSELPAPITSSSVVSVSSSSSSTFSEPISSTSSESSSSISIVSSSSISLSSSSSMTISNTSTSIIPSSITSSSVISSSSSSSASSTLLAPLTGCAVASEISGYAPAASYCSSAYPVTTYTSLFSATITDTVTDTGVASTIYGNVTLPAETNVQTIEETVTQTSFFPVEVTETETTTTTTTVSSTPAALQRRQRMPSVAASILSSILSRPASDIALVCSCLQTPVTDSATSTVTVLSTTTSTPVISANRTFTPPIMTLQTTETNTETIDVTTITGTTTSTSTEVVTVLIVSVTSSYESTYTTIQATSTIDIETITTCTVGTVSPVGSCQNTVYSAAGSYYSEQCDNSVVSGSVRYTIIGVTNVNQCIGYCSRLPGFSCNVAAYVPTSTRCFLAQTTSGSFTTFGPGVQAVGVYSTNPCVATVTSTGTGYSTETITSQIITVFESSVTSSATPT